MPSLASQTLYLTATWGKGLVKLAYTTVDKCPGFSWTTYVITSWSVTTINTHACNVLPSNTTSTKSGDWCKPPHHAVRYSCLFRTDSTSTIHLSILFYYSYSHRCFSSMSLSSIVDVYSSNTSCLLLYIFTL